MQNFNPERISLARRLEGISQRELSDKSGVSQAKLSKLQNGITELGENDALRLAAALDYPISFFERHSRVVPLIELTYRKTSKSSVAELAAVSSEYSLLASVVQQLTAALHLTSKVGWIDDIAPHRQNNMTVHEIDAIADVARAHLGMNATGPVPNVTRMLERSGIVVVPMRSVHVGTQAHLTSEGVTDPTMSPKCIGYIGKVTLSGDRLRFTKAHELGHLLLHRYRKPDSPQQVEREAHLFAAALLLPRADARTVLRANMSLRDFLPVKAGWGLSIAALISRSHTLGIIDKQRYQSLCIQLSTKGWKKREPVPVEIEKPLLVKQMIEAMYGTQTDNGVRVDSLAASTDLGLPFRYLDYWSGGIMDTGESQGVKERRFIPANQTDEA